MSRNEIRVDAPAAFLFPYIAEGDKIAEWSRDDRLEISFPRGKEARVGMQIHFLIKLPTDPAWLVEIRSLTPEREMRTAIVDGIFRGSISFFLTPLSDGQTKLVHEAEIIPQGRFMKFAWEAAGQRIHREKMEEILGKIKTLVEERWKQEQKTVSSRRR